MNKMAMFNFLVEEAPKKVVDLDLVNDWAKEAAAAFLGSDKAPLNHTIQKIAQVEQLTPEMINLLCQETNKTVHGRLFKTAEDKYVNFELANASGIVGDMDKTASVKSDQEQNLDQDYGLAPDEKFSHDFAFSKTAGHVGYEPSQKHKNTAALEKLAFNKKLIEDDHFVTCSQIKSLEKAFVKTARNQIMVHPLTDREGQLPYVAKFCKEAGLDTKSSENLMHLLGTVMIRQGLLEKTADLKVGPELISDNLNARIVNGNHPLFITVKTLVDKNRRKEALENEHNIIKTKIDCWKGEGAILGQKVKVL